MSSFTTPLSYEPTGTFRSGRPEYRVTAPFRYEVGEIGSGLVLTVEEGFVTDLASVPWPFCRSAAPFRRTGHGQLRQPDMTACTPAASCPVGWRT